MAIDLQPTEFVLTYDGTALREGSMAVRDLAPALLALGEMVHEAHVIANPAEPPVNLEIRAFDRGSFDVIIHVVREASGILSSPEATSVANLIVCVTATLALIRSLAGKLPDRAEPQDDGTTRLELPDTREVLVVPSEVYEMVQRPSVRRNAQEVVRPLHRDGVDRLIITRGRQPEVEIVKADVEAFDLIPPPPEFAMPPTVFRVGLTINTVAFEERNKWRLSDGEAVAWYLIEDEGIPRAG